MIERLSAAFATPRLDVRLVDEADLEALSAINGDDEVVRYLPYDAWRTPEDAAAWFARTKRLHGEGRARQFVVVERADARIVGTAVVFNVDERHRRAEVGYVLGRRDWGRGLMREAMTAVLVRVFVDLHVVRIEAYADPRNAASHRMLLALGFTHEGLLRRRSVIRGESVDANVYGLLADDARRRFER